MFSTALKKRIVPLLATAIAPFCLNGCLTIELTRLADPDAPPEKGSIEVRVFEKGSDESHGNPTKRQIVTELFRKEKDGFRSVRETTDPSWVLSDLQPGEYEVRVSRWVDEEGRVQNLRSSDRESFQLRPGRRVRADVILSDKGGATGGIIGAVCAVLATIGVIAALSRLHIEISEDAAPRKAPPPSRPVRPASEPF